MRRASTLALSVTAVVASLSGCGDAPPQQPNPSETPPPAPSSTPAPPASATIGPDGGEIGLPDGTTLSFPPGSVAEPVEILISAAEPEPIPLLDDGYVRVGVSFTIQPPLVVSGEEPLVVTLDSSVLPPGATPRDAVLIKSTDGISESRPSGEPGTRRLTRVHPGQANRSDAGAIEFDLHWISAARHQVVVYVDEGESGATGGGPTGLPPGALGLVQPPGATLDFPCSQVVPLYLGVDAPADIDDRVAIVPTGAPKLLEHYYDSVDLAAQPGFVDAMNRFHARLCLRTDQSRTMLEDAGVYVPPGPVWVSFGAWDPYPECDLADASGNGIAVYMISACDAAGWDGFVPAGLEDSGWNTDVPPGASAELHVDGLDSTCAHEMYHYAEAWANGDADNEESPAFFAEGQADSFAEMAYDEVFGFAGEPIELWDGGFWDLEYPAHAFWRWVDDRHGDGTIAGTSAVRALQKLRARFLAGEPVADGVDWVLLDEMLLEMSGELTYEANDAFADFAVASLFTHDYERVAGPGACPANPDDECPDHEASDPTPDALGLRIAEMGPHGLWADQWTDDGGGQWLVKGRDVLTTPSGAVLAPATRADLPASISVDLAGSGADGLVIDLPDPLTDPAATDAPVHLELQAWDASGAASDEVVVRVFSKAPDGEVVPIGAFDELSVSEPIKVFVGGASANEDELVVVAASTSDEDLSFEVNVTNVEEQPLVLASFTDSIGVLDVDIPAMGASVCDNGQSPQLGDSLRLDVVEIHVPFDGWAVAYPVGVVKVFRKSDCAEVAEIGLPLGLGGAAALAVTDDGRSLVVGQADYFDPCAPGAITLVDLDTVGDAVPVGAYAFLGLPLGAGDLALVDDPLGELVVVTQPGAAACFSSTLEAVYVQELEDAGPAAPDTIVEHLPIAGVGVQQPTRLAVTGDGAWVAWVTENENGRIGVMRVLDRAVFLIEPDDSVFDPFDTPVDLDLAEIGGQIYVVFVTLGGSLWVDPAVDCTGVWPECSSYTLARLDPASGLSEIISRRELPFGQASRVAITADATRGFVTYLNTRNMTVLNLGTGSFDAFHIDTATPLITTVLIPSEIILPK